MLSGKVAFVTGGGSGIGRATCKVFAREGAQVAFADLHEEALKKTLSLLPGNSHSYYVVDVSNKDKIQSAVENIIAKYKSPPTIVANCAGLSKTSLPMGVDEKVFDRHYAVNVKGPLNVIQVICKELVERKLPGSVINIGSVVVKTHVAPHFGDYAASKAAVTTLTQYLSHDLGKHNIRCNVIHPGVIDTPMSRAEPEEIVRKGYMKADLQRIGQPEEVAEVIAFLASDKSSYVAGAEIMVSGGL